MKNLKWVGISLGGLTVLIIVVGSILHLMGQNKLNFAPTVTKIGRASCRERV